MEGAPIDATPETASVFGFTYASDVERRGCNYYWRTLISFYLAASRSLCFSSVIRIRAKVVETAVVRLVGLGHDIIGT